MEHSIFFGCVRTEKRCILSVNHKTKTVLALNASEVLLRKKFHQVVCVMEDENHSDVALLYSKSHDNPFELKLDSEQDRSDFKRICEICLSNDNREYLETYAQHHIKKKHLCRFKRNQEEFQIVFISVQNYHILFYERDSPAKIIDCITVCNFAILGECKFRQAMQLKSEFNGNYYIKFDTEREHKYFVKVFTEVKAKHIRHDMQNRINQGSPLDHLVLQMQIMSLFESSQALQSPSQPSSPVLNSPQNAGVQYEDLKAFSGPRNGMKPQLRAPSVASISSRGSGRTEDTMTSQSVHKFGPRQRQLIVPKPGVSPSRTPEGMYRSLKSRSPAPGMRIVHSEQADDFSRPGGYGKSPSCSRPRSPEEMKRKPDERRIRPESPNPPNTFDFVRPGIRIPSINRQVSRSPAKIPMENNMGAKHFLDASDYMYDVLVPLKVSTAQGPCTLLAGSQVKVVERKRKKKDGRTIIQFRISDPIAGICYLVDDQGRLTINNTAVRRQYSPFSWNQAMQDFHRNFQWNGKHRSMIIYWGSDHSSKRNRVVEVPSKVSTLSDLKLVSLCIPSQATHGFGISEDCKLFVFGETMSSTKWNPMGLHMKTTSYRPSLVPKFSNHQVIQVCGSNEHTIVLTSDGQVFGWGKSELTGRHTDTSTPKPLKFLKDYRIVGICSSSHVNCAWDIRGRLFTWGKVGPWLGLGEELSPYENNHVSVPFGEVDLSPYDSTHIQRVSCSTHVLVLMSNGKVFSFGNNQCGQLGVDLLESCSVPQIVTEFPSCTDVSAGLEHSVFLDVNGQIYTCGSNAYLQSGHSRPMNYLVPTLLDCFHTRMVRVEAGAYHTFAISTYGCVVLWGKEPYADDTNLPHVVEDLRHWRTYQIVSGSDFCMALGVLVASSVNKEGLPTGPERSLVRLKQQNSRRRMSVEKQNRTRDKSEYANSIPNGDRFVNQVSRSVPRMRSKKRRPSLTREAIISPDGKRPFIVEPTPQPAQDNGLISYQHSQTKPPKLIVSGSDEPYQQQENNILESISDDPEDRYIISYVKYGDDVNPQYKRSWSLQLHRTKQFVYSYLDDPEHVEVLLSGHFFKYDYKELQNFVKNLQHSALPKRLVLKVVSFLPRCKHRIVFVITKRVINRRGVLERCFTYQHGNIRIYGKWNHDLFEVRKLDICSMSQFVGPGDIIALEKENSVYEF